MQISQTPPPATGRDTLADPVDAAEATLRSLRAAPDRWALFLDIDGTLVDLAETPDGIVVESGLPQRLIRLSELLGGALALVTGRALARAEALFAPARLPIAGLHGAELRGADQQPPPQAYLATKSEAADFAEARPGVLFEDKGLAFALHYRGLPEAEAEVRRYMEAALVRAGTAFQLQSGKMVTELRPSNGDKGMALTAFLAQPAFAGRLPIAIGDDLTDEAMFRVAEERGGRGIRIGPTLENSAATERLPSPDALRALLAEIV